MTPTEPPDQLSLALDRRARTFRRWRVVVLALVVGYFFLPYEIQAWIPVWLPFFLALGLEVHFFLGGYLQSQRDLELDLDLDPRDDGPQPRDLADLGGDPWLETIPVEHEGEQHFIPIEGLLTDEEVHERIEAYLADPEGTLAEVEEEDDETPVPEQPSYRRHVVEALVAIALVTGILVYASRPHGWDAVSAANRARLEARLSHEATRVAGHRAEVRCDTSGQYVGVVQEADGLATVGGTRAYLTPAICNTLYQLSVKHRVQSFPATARAIAVLAHESWHLRGVANEGLANCFGFQSGVGVGIDLGLSESKARAMMREQLATNASDSTGSPAYLVPDGCHNGGTYDLHPGVRAFP